METWKAVKIYIHGTFKKFSLASSKCSGYLGMYRQGSCSHRTYLLECHIQSTSNKINKVISLIHEDNKTGQFDKKE